MFDCVRILVLNYDGRELLAECLPSVVACARNAAVPCRVSVIDNESTDDSVTFVRSHWPDVDVIQATNRGLVSFNDVVRAMAEPLVVLLNNDVKMELGCVDQLVAPFHRHADCFLTAPLCLSFDGKYEGTLSELRFDRGLVSTRLRKPAAGGSSVAQDSAIHTVSAGAVLAVRRDRFLALRGFDSLFLPGRYEDLDLAFRGWLAGWKAYFVASAVAYHKGSATFRPKLGAACHRLDARNAILFAWKHLCEPRHIFEHAVYLPLRVLYSVAAGQVDFLRGVCDAMRMWSAVKSRRASMSARTRSETEIFRMLRARWA